ncbi:hypothetical protein V0U79_03195 [Hyphobacterium sp. HN65]|uniref:DUF4345 domain-containing protein n=1 Tax=Hyphobacterium lacteum TaxID=3116575 RepID=A0ABU7LN91_9PROT|nr:hypothetical protein [Hyphobacterium sp. HN65]MEE2525358.1 hypothetical protein [Hyphobacterium sp. HN65]
MEMVLLPTVLAALVGCAMGGASLLVPRWGASVVRLQPDPRWKGGWSEFRASYGGAFLLGHAAVLLTYAMRFQAGEAALMGTGFAMGALWMGMAIGRVVSMVADDREYETRTAYNYVAVGFESLMGLALWAPFLAHIGR